MNAIRIHKQIDSETLHLPEIRPLIGEQVEIIVIEENPVAQGRTSNSPYDAFFALAGKDAIDPDALGQLRAARVV